MPRVPRKPVPIRDGYQGGLGEDLDVADEARPRHAKRESECVSLSDYGPDGWEVDEDPGRWRPYYSSSNPLSFASPPRRGRRLAHVHGREGNNLSNDVLAYRPRLPRTRASDMENITNRGRKYAMSIVYSFLILLGILLIVLAALTIKYATTDTAGFGADGPDFALYKNSRFQECAARDPALANCSLVDGGLNAINRDPEHQAMLAFEYPFEQDGPLAYDWCSLASCFKDFKVIPSTARPSATRRSSILVWCSINMAAISGVWAIRKLLSGQRHDPEHCPGVSLFDWGVYAYDLGSFVFWWYEISAVARDPAAAAQISILNWIKTVGYLLLVNQHPISCQLHQHPRLKKSIFSAVLIIAVAQWIATCFAVGTQYDDILPTKRAPKLSAKYECLASRIEDAPGTTSCSADVLCSMSWMYSVADFLDEERSALFYAGILFICVSTLFPLFILVSFRDAMLDKQSFTIRRETILHVPRWLAGGLALYYVLGNIAIAILVLVDIQHKSASMDREAPLTYHLGCTALHLAFSPWRQYLDINDKGRALRVAKGWFNA